jgi:hypothetical protein
VTATADGEVEALPANDRERPSYVVGRPAAHDRAGPEVSEPRDLGLAGALITGRIRKQDLALDPPQ